MNAAFTQNSDVFVLSHIGETAVCTQAKQVACGCHHGLVKENLPKKKKCTFMEMFLYVFTLLLFIKSYNYEYWYKGFEWKITQDLIQDTKIKTTQADYSNMKLCPSFRFHTIKCPAEITMILHIDSFQQRSSALLKIKIMLFSTNWPVLSMSLIQGCKSLKKKTVNSWIQLKMCTQQFILDAISLQNLSYCMWLAVWGGKGQIIILRKKHFTGSFFSLFITLCCKFFSEMFCDSRDHQVAKSPASWTKCPPCLGTESLQFSRQCF